MLDLHHPGYGPNKQCFRSTTEISKILDKSLNPVLTLLAHSMLFLSREECRRGKVCDIFSVSGLSVQQMSSDLLDSQQSTLWKTHKTFQKQKKEEEKKQHKNRDPLSYKSFQSSLLHIFLASNIYSGVGQRGELAACLLSGVESLTQKAGEREHQKQIERKTKSALSRVSLQFCVNSGHNDCFTEFCCSDFVPLNSLMEQPRQRKNAFALSFGMKIEFWHEVGNKRCVQLLLLCVNHRMLVSSHDSPQHCV